MNEKICLKILRLSKTAEPIVYLRGIECHRQPARGFIVNTGKRSDPGRSRVLAVSFKGLREHGDRVEHLQEEALKQGLVLLLEGSSHVWRR